MIEQAEFITITEAAQRLGWSPQRTSHTVKEYRERFGLQTRKGTKDKRKTLVDFTHLQKLVEEKDNQL